MRAMIKAICQLINFFKNYTQNHEIVWIVNIELQSILRKLYKDEYLI